MIESVSTIRDSNTFVDDMFAEPFVFAGVIVGEPSGETGIATITLEKPLSFDSLAESAPASGALGGLISLQYEHEAAHNWTAIALQGTYKADGNYLAVGNAVVRAQSVGQTTKVGPLLMRVYETYIEITLRIYNNDNTICYQPATKERLTMAAIITIALEEPEHMLAAYRAEQES